MIKRYVDAVSYIETLSNVSIAKRSGQRAQDPSFFPRKMQYFLDLIGNPEKGMKFVHVTGTGGKGTVSAMIHGALVADSRKAGLFTSPYATTAIEEIKVGDTYISPDEFADIVEYLKPFVDKASQDKQYGRPSAFGIFFAVALIYFKRQTCEWAVIEVGVGGRYDFTNVIQDPVATVITHIDYDHTSVLGKTLREIAFDKAGIIKKGSQFFTTEPRPVLQKMFQRVCKEEGAFFHEVSVSPGEDANESLAFAVARSLGVAEKEAKKGIGTTCMPCRFEIMGERPFVILDGAHNRSKMRNTAGRLETLSFRRLSVILAVSNLNTDNTAIFREIVPKADSVILTSFDSSKRKSIHPKAILPLIKPWKKKGAFVHIVDDPNEALDFALGEASKDDCILVTGSFFLAGELRKRWFSEKWVLEQKRSFK